MLKFEEESLRLNDEKNTLDIPIPVFDHLLQCRKDYDNIKRVREISSDLKLLMKNAEEGKISVSELSLKLNELRDKLNNNFENSFKSYGCYNAVLALTESNLSVNK